MLDLRYNAMWNDWGAAAGADEPLDPAWRADRRRLVLSWKRLNVSVEKSVHRYFSFAETTRSQILHNVSGNVQCGNLLGIMGPSGSGKTTLMATISYRTKGNFNGELFLNGYPVSEEVMVKISGFVPQHDLTFEQLTVSEHLYLMAKLKLDRRLSKTDLNGRIDYVVRTIGMHAILDTRLSFLSGGERKKVALAVQLLNDPSILFCDEITTGLDSFSAAHIINTLKCVARTGKIVICTIHQPASGVFDKFDDVVLLSKGRLVYQGSVLLVNQFFRNFSYSCPDMYNKADFVISVLNSEDKEVMDNIDKMCESSSTEKQTNLNYDLFKDEMMSEDYSQHLQIQKPLWITQLILVLTRSAICMLRNYKIKFLELGTLMFLGTILSIPYMNVKFDVNAVQNWQGFWFSLTTNSIFQFCYTSIITFQAEFSIVHREVSNQTYALSVYYISQIVITLFWTILESLVYIYLVFWIVGIKWELLLVTTFVINMLICRAYGSVLSAFFEKFDNIVLFSLMYDYFGVALSGAYLSLGSLPKVLYYLKFLSIFFLGCETLSILQWKDTTFIPCFNVNNCLHNGKEVLLSYGYDIDRFDTDLIILAAIYIGSYVIGYYGLLKRIQKQPAY